jgi:hypothetical protein
LRPPRRLEENRQVDLAANAVYERWRATARDTLGRRLKDYGRAAPAGGKRVPEAVIADAGYWHSAQMHAITDHGIEVLVPPDGNMRELGERPL